MRTILGITNNVRIKKSSLFTYLVLKIKHFFDKYNVLHYTPYRMKRVYEIYYKLGYIDEKTFKKMTRDRNWFRWSKLYKQIDKTNRELNNFYDNRWKECTEEANTDHWLDIREDGKCIEYRSLLGETEAPKKCFEDDGLSELEKQANEEYLKGKFEKYKTEVSKQPSAFYLYFSKTKTKEELKRYGEYLKRHTIMDWLSEEYSETMGKSKLDSPAYVWEQ